MEEVILEAQERSDLGTGKVNRLRKKALLPAIVYGEGKKPLAVQLTAKDFMNLISVHKGESFVIKLRIKAGAKQEDKSVLIKQIQHDPAKDDVIHIDFHEISLTKTIKVKVPVVARGEAIGVKRDGGVLDHTLWELEVECLPARIPETIEADVSHMQIGDSLHVRELTPIEGVKILNDPEAAVLAVVAPTKEAIPSAEEAAAAEVKTEPEVIKEKKEKAPEGAGAETAGKAAQEKK